MSGGTVLVLAEGTNAGPLAAVRALAADGHEVVVASPSYGSIAGRSRAVRRHHRISWADEDRPAFVASVAALGADVVLPGSDVTLAALAASADRIPSRLPFPAGRVPFVLDKLLLSQVGSRIGLAVPATVVATDQALASWEGPAVVKNRSHCGGRLDTMIASDSRQAAAHAAQIRASGGEPLLQAVVEGALVAVILVVAPDGRLLSWLQQRAQRVWPRPAGISSRAVTVAPDPTLIGGVHRLVGELGWWGVAQAQFLERRDGTAVLIDLNPRLYGSLPLAVGAGLPIPSQLVSLARGENVPVAGGGRAGVNYSWFEGDLLRALAERRGGLPVDMVETVLAARRSVRVVWDPRDPAPAAGVVATAAMRAVRKFGG